MPLIGKKVKRTHSAIGGHWNTKQKLRDSQGSGEENMGAGKD